MTLTRRLARVRYQTAVHRWRPYRPDGDHPRYFLYVLRASASGEVFSRFRNASTIDHLTAEQLRRLRFPFPSFSEQRAIASFLDRETAKIDALVEKVRRAIELLQEVRTALISAAVTGKIDVRDAAGRGDRSDLEYD